jgi:hypothetical protein
MFIGLSPSCVSAQAINAGGGGGTPNPDVIASSNDGDFPSGIQAGDVIFTALSSTTFIAIAIDFTSTASGSSGGVNYNLTYKIADGTETGSIGAVAQSTSCLVLRNVDIANLVTSVTSGASWNSLAGLTPGSTIIAMGYSNDGSGNFGGVTIPSGWTTYQSSGLEIVAVKDETVAGTSVAFTGLSNGGSLTMCYSIGIA